MRNTVWYPVILLFAWSHSCFAQRVQLLNMSLTQPDTAIAFTGDLQSFILKGDLAGKTIELTRSGGSVLIKPGTSIRFNIRYESSGTDTFHVMIDGKTVLEKVYTITAPNCPIVFGVEGQEADSIHAGKLALSKGPSLISPACLYRVRGNIISYTIAFTTPRGAGRRVKVNGTGWPEDFHSNTGLNTPGASLQFSEINCIASDGKALKLPDTTLRIVP